MLRPQVTLGELARPCPVVDGSLTAAEANAVFEAHPLATSVAVRTRRGVGLLTRLRLRDVLTGGLGYGWALHHRKPVEGLLPRGQVLFEAGTSLAAAGEAANRRGDAERYDDLLVVGDDVPLGTVAVSTLLSHLADFYANGARRDALTGVLNRAAIHDHLVAAVEQRRSKLVGVGYVDLDGFKAINDRLGHDAGDHILRAVAARLHDAVGEDAALGRVGGDEFLAVVPADHTDVLLGRLDRALGLVARPVDRVDGLVTASAGAAFARPTPIEAALEAGQAVRSADQAMYLAKARGGNQVALAPLCA